MYSSGVKTVHGKIWDTKWNDFYETRLVYKDSCYVTEVGMAKIEKINKQSVQL